MANVSATGATQPAGFTNQPVGGTGVFSGHNVQIDGGWHVAMERLKSDCQICNTSLSLSPSDSDSGRSKGSGISVVDVESIYHQNCLNRLATPQESQETLEKIRGANVFTDIDELKKKINSLQAKCQQCGIVGAFEALTSASGCTNPSFFQRNEQGLTELLNHKFQEAHFTDVYIDGATEKNIIAIRVVATDTLDAGKKKTYCYYSRDIGQGRNDKECFAIMNEAVHADLTLRNIYIQCPNAFNDSTCLHIKNYSVFENTLTLSHNGQECRISFDSLFDHNGNFNEPAFKNALALSGLSYEVLLSNK